MILQDNVSKHGIDLQYFIINNRGYKYQLDATMPILAFTCVTIEFKHLIEKCRLFHKIENTIEKFFLHFELVETLSMSPLALLK